MVMLNFWRTVYVRYWSTKTIKTYEIQIDHMMIGMIDSIRQIILQKRLSNTNLVESEKDINKTNILLCYNLICIAEC